MNFPIVRRLRLHGQNQGPGLTRMAVNFARAGARQGVHIARGAVPFVSEEQAESNLMVCWECPDGMFDLARVRCLDKRCGCNLKRKTRWATAECPRGYWSNRKGEMTKPDLGEKVNEV